MANILMEKKICPLLDIKFISAPSIFKHYMLHSTKITRHARKHGFVKKQNVNKIECLTVMTELLELPVRDFSKKKKQPQ